MQPFRTSLTARMVSISVAFALVAGGLIPLLGIAPSLGIPVVLLLGAGGCIAGLVLGVADHPGAVAVLAIVLPLALWPYVMLLGLVATRYSEFAPYVVIAGAGVFASTFFARVSVRAPVRVTGAQVAH